MKFKVSKKWCLASAKKEAGQAVGAGLPLGPAVLTPAQLREQYPLTDKHRLRYRR